jgi:hypothetical protein
MQLWWKGQNVVNTLEKPQFNHMAIIIIIIIIIISRMLWNSSPY